MTSTLVSTCISPASKRSYISFLSSTGVSPDTSFGRNTRLIESLGHVLGMPNGAAEDQGEATLSQTLPRADHVIQKLRLITGDLKLTLFEITADRMDAAGIDRTNP